MGRKTKARAAKKKSEKMAAAKAAAGEFPRHRFEFFWPVRVFATGGYERLLVGPKRYRYPLNFLSSSYPLLLSLPMPFQNLQCVSRGQRSVQNEQRGDAARERGQFQARGNRNSISAADRDPPPQAATDRHAFDNAAVRCHAMSAA
mmetsp:Transcript_16878/g.33675  ORF Transcript_16878/g.33675 Transcript_16878/m.33675 type:complete len:146 (-) Transcript_16878:223-660(-)